MTRVRVLKRYHIMEKSPRRAAHTVIYLFGRASLVSPRGTPSWQAHLQPASAVKIMRWCYRISIHWKNIFQIPQMGSKVTRDSGCELTCLGLPPLSPLLSSLWRSSAPPWVPYGNPPLAEGLHEANVPILSWSQPVSANALKLRTRITMWLKIFFNGLHSES